MPAQSCSRADVAAAEGLEGTSERPTIAFASCNRTVSGRFVVSTNYVMALFLVPLPLPLRTDPNRLSFHSIRSITFNPRIALNRLTYPREMKWKELERRAAPLPRPNDAVFALFFVLLLLFPVHGTIQVLDTCPSRSE